MRQHTNNTITELVFVNEDSFDPSVTHYVWNAVVPVVFTYPEIFSDLQTRYLTVDDASDLNSGRAVTKSQHSHIGMAKGTGMPEGVKSVQILVEIDQDAFWDLHVDMLSD